MRLRFHALLLLAAVTALSAFAEQNPSVSLKYDLRSGDRLVYSEVIEKETRGESFQQAIRVTLTNQVLVLAESKGAVSIGIQRDRNSATLVSYRENGRDAFRQQLPKFEAAAAKIPKQTYQSNEFNLYGMALGDTQVRREWPSRLLFAVPEIGALPSTPQKPGQSWTSRDMLGLDFTYLRDEPFGEESCAVLSGVGFSGTMHLQYWFGLTSHILRKVTYTAEYNVPGGIMHERVSFELKEVNRGESTAEWLEDNDTQLATLAALQRSAWVKAPSESVSRLATGEPGTARTLAVSLLRRRGVAVREVSSPTTEERGLIAAPSKPGIIADPLSLPGDFYRGMESAPFGGRPYIVHVPMDYTGEKEFPLLIYLSGGSGSAIDGYNSSARAVEGSEFLVLYPHATGMWWEPPSEKMLDALFAEVLSKYKVDRNHIYIVGFSNGGTGSVHFASIWPDRFAGVVSLEGAGCMKGIADPGKLVKTPVLLVHGDIDSVVPVQCSKDLYKSLQKRNAPVRLEILRGRDHDLTLDTDDGLTMTFLRGLETKSAN